MGCSIGDILKTSFDLIRIVLKKRYIFRKVVLHPTWHWKVINIKCICLNLPQMSSKNYAIFLGGGGEVIKRSHWITGGRGGGQDRPKKGSHNFERSVMSYHSTSWMSRQKSTKNYTRLISIVSKPIYPISYGISIPTMLRGAGVKFTPQLKTHLGVIDSNFIKHTYKPMSK